MDSSATIIITSALVFYSIGVWSERIMGRLKPWHLVFFVLGLICDTWGTGMMFKWVGGMMFDIFDDKTRKIIEEEGLVWPGAYGGQQRSNPRFQRPLAGQPLPGLGEELKAAAAKTENLKIADTLDEIAQYIGADPLKFKATVDEYNAACDQGYDPVFCKDRRYLLPIRSGPFYAVKGVASITDAIGGIKINENMQVLESEDEPIPGLYAAGSCTGQWETKSYCYELTGHLLGFALNSGRIAGENATRYMSLQLLV